MKVANLNFCSHTYIPKLFFGFTIVFVAVPDRSTSVRIIKIEVAILSQKIRKKKLFMG